MYLNTFRSHLKSKAQYYTDRIWPCREMIEHFQFPLFILYLEKQLENIIFGECYWLSDSRLCHSVGHFQGWLSEELFVCWAHPTSSRAGSCVPTEEAGVRLARIFQKGFLAGRGAPLERKKRCGGLSGSQKLQLLSFTSWQQQGNMDG